MKVKAITPVRHDGVDYEAEEVIEKISDAQAQELIDAGVAEEVDAKATKKPTQG
jgi:hypothetical protein